MENILSSKEIEIFLNHFNHKELEQIRNLLYLGYYNLNNIYDEIIKILDKVELDKPDGPKRYKTKIHNLNNKELLFLDMLIDSASFSNIEEIDEYIESKDEDYKYSNTSYIPKEYDRDIIEDLIIKEKDKRKIKE